jgi:hypothetical protein
MHIRNFNSDEKITELFLDRRNTVGVFGPPFLLPSHAYAEN